jgi:hypothetical protein
MAKMTAAEAGKLGGRSRSAKKLEAARRNGFQPCKELEHRTASTPPVLITPRPQVQE